VKGGFRCVFKGVFKMTQTNEKNTQKHAKRKKTR